MYVGAAVVPPESPLHACRPAIGLLNVASMVRVYPPAIKSLPPVVMSLKAPPLILISRTIPSNPRVGVTPLASMLNRFLKVSCAPPAGTLIVGVSRVVLPMLLTSGAKASLGALFGFVAEVTQFTSTPVAAVTQPAGRAGGAAPSKFSLKVVTVLSVPSCIVSVSYTHLRAHETPEHLVCRLLLEK